MTKKIILLTTFVLASALVVFGADVTGKWTAQVQGRNGTQERVFNLKADGGKLTGTVTGFQGQEQQISDGKVEGDKVTFTVKVEFNGNSFEQKYAGMVSGDDLKLTMEMGGGRGRGPQEINAKRSK